MRTVEVRIPMPMTVDEYFLAQMWTFNELSNRDPGGGERVDVVADEPFTGEAFLGGKFTSGQYTKKIYHVESNVPKLIRALLLPMIGKGGFELHEEAWNAFPYCRTVITNPGYMGDDLRLVFETLHLSDAGGSDNVLGMDAEEYAGIPVQTLDIASDPSSLLPIKCDPRKFRSAKTDRGPLEPKRWIKQQDHPIMTCYKFVTVHFKWLGAQSAVESALLEHYRKMLLAFHQHLWCCADEWHGLTLEDVRRLEREKTERLKSVRQDKRGSSD